MESNGLKTRQEIKAEDKWAIEDLYETDEKWEEEYAEVEKMADKFLAYQGKLGASAKNLCDYLQYSDEVGKKAERVYVYANQKMHEDLGNTKYQGYAAKATNLSMKLAEVTSFAEPEILEIPKETLEAFLTEDSGLSLYQRYFEEILRRKEHTLSKELEELLAKTIDMGNAASDIFQLFNNADLRFPDIIDETGKKVSLTHGRYISFLENHDRAVRKQAFQTLYHMYEKYKNTLAATYSASVKKDVFYANVRKYASSLQMALEDVNVPVSVYENLIETVHKNLSGMYRYVELRKKALHLEELHMYDLYVPMVQEVEFKVDFETAKKMVKEGLAPMGEEYLQVLQQGFDERWIDIYENQGKRSGAYSWGAYGTHPYVLLNYQNNLNNVFTLAHEMGHALHSYYSDKTQPYIYAGYKIFVAEVASTCNESLLIHHLLNKTEDKKQKAYLINYFLEQFRGTLFRQTMFAEFEKITHELVERKEVLTEENLCQIYYDLNKKYFGDGLVIDSEIAMEWARIPHFYNAFYVYQYATGFSAAIALSRRIMEKGEEGVKDYMKFLTGGSSKDPIDLLRMAGVDMASPQPIEEAMEVFQNLLVQLEELI